MRNYILLFFLSGLSLFSYAQDISLFEVEGRWGVRSDGKVIAKPKYDDARILEFGNRKLILISIGGESGLINEQGKTILDIKNQGIYTMGDKYLYTWIGARGRIIDLDGKTVMKGLQNIGISSFWEGQSLPFKKDEKWGYLNIGFDVYTSDEIYTTSCIYDDAKDTSGKIKGGAVVKKEGKWGAINLLLRGRTIVDFTFDTADELYRVHPELLPQRPIAI